MDIQFSTLSAAEKYKLIAASIIPRPIALITSMNGDGTINAAPFSAFNYVSDEPPLIVVGIQVHPEQTARHGELKDTYVNILRTGEFVINMVEEDLLDAAAACAADFPAGISETASLGLSTTASLNISVPRLTKSPVAMECRLWDNIPASKTRNIIIGEILSMHFRPEIFNSEKKYINSERYFPIGRLFASQYVRTHDRISTPILSSDAFLATIRT